MADAMWMREVTNERIIDIILPTRFPVERRNKTVCVCLGLDVVDFLFEEIRPLYLSRIFLQVEHVEVLEIYVLRIFETQNMASFREASIVILIWYDTSSREHTRDSYALHSKISA